MQNIWKPLIIGLSIVISFAILAGCYVHVNKAKRVDVVSVNGLGETTFTSDLIIWEGQVTVTNYSKIDGYQTIENQRKKVEKYLLDNGLTQEEITFKFVNIENCYTSIYNDDGNYVGQEFVHYSLTQRFVVTSSKVDEVERISREISTLIAQGIDIESYSPQYYYTKLDEIKHSLIEKASKDARERAEKVVSHAGAKLGKAKDVRLGVFQITAATGDEEYSYGGAFNTSSREKKARVTVKMEYVLK